MFRSSLILLCLFCNSLYAEELQWNRYSKNDFVVLSIDDKQGSILIDKMDYLVDSIYNDWNIQKKDLRKECRIFCVPDKESLQRLFSLSDSHVEIREDLYVIWTFYDKNKIKSCLTEIVVSELNGGFWFRRGVLLSSKSINEIKTDISLIKKRIDDNENLYTTSQIFDVTEEKYYNFSKDMQDLFDQQSFLLCLMLRKEFGQVKLYSFIKIQNKEIAINKVYRFKNLAHFDKQYIHYLHDLGNDVVVEKTPESYLQIAGKNK